MTLTALPINASGGSPSYTARQTRQAFSALMMPGLASLRTRSGFRVGGQPTVSVTSSTWTVGGFSCVIDAGVSSIQGPYLVASDGNTTGSITAADATFARKDILYIQLSDTDEDGSGARAANPLYLPGIPAASPSAPATPARSLLVGVIDVPHSGAGSPAFTASGTYWVAAGGVVPVASAAEQAALPAYAGLMSLRMDFSPPRVDTYDGTAWQPGPTNRTILEHIDVTGTNLASNFSSESTLYSTASTAWPANRRLRVDVSGAMVTGAGTGFPYTYEIKIKEGSTQIADGIPCYLAAQAVPGRYAGSTVIHSPGTSSVLSVTARRITGSLGSDAITGIGNPFMLTVTDIGPSSGGTNV